MKLTKWAREIKCLVVCASLHAEQWRAVGRCAVASALWTLWRTSSPGVGNDPHLILGSSDVTEAYIPSALLSVLFLNRSIACEKEKDQN